MLQVQLNHLGLGDKASLVSRFVECFKTMWANNGNLVSRTYTGTGAMEGGARVRNVLMLRQIVKYFKLENTSGGKVVLSNFRIALMHAKSSLVRQQVTRRCGVRETDDQE
jgi:hypothetical protein